jgi:hypothetical protein
VILGDRDDPGICMSPPGPVLGVSHRTGDAGVWDVRNG